MPKSGTYGSVRGVPGNRHPYRDRQHCAASTQSSATPILTEQLSSELIDAGFEPSES